MKILAINICLRGGSSRLIPPVGLGYILTALTNAGFEFDLLDLDLNRELNENIEGALKKFSFDVVIMGCIVTGYRHIKKISSIVKELNKDSIIIVGNSAASSIPELLLEKTDVDIAVIGEGDITIIKILNALKERKTLGNIRGIYFKKRGEIFKTGKRDLIQNIDELPFINWDIFDIHAYLRKSNELANEPCPIDYEDRIVMSVPVARGCRYNCSFCYHVFKGCKYRARSVQSIIMEIKSLKKKYNINYINFWDDMTFASKRYCYEFVRMLRDENINIFWNATTRGDFLSSNDRDLVRGMKKAGCVGLSYSLESANRDILKMMNKHFDPNRLSDQKKILDDFGMASWISIIIGYPGETEEMMNETFDFCLENKFYPSLGYLLPQPGTPIYEYSKEKGFINDEEGFLINMGDRQDLIINICGIESKKMVNLVSNRLSELNEKLNIGLSKEELVKTKCKRDPKKIAHTITEGAQ